MEGRLKSWFSLTELNTLYCILATIFNPITITFVLTQLKKRYQEQKYRGSLPGKVVLITGASSGLGESLAHVFYKAGCKVILAARRNDELERVKKELLNLNVKSTTYLPIIQPLDLGELNSIPAVVAEILSVHNHIDILINNGGISVRADVVSSTIDVDLKVMLVNYFGSVALTKAILPPMIERGTGHIVFISSVQGKFALPHRSSYSASKHALQAFSDSLRAEVASKGLKVTCISPGYIRTQLSVNALTGSGESYGKMDESTASGTSPEQMAASILRTILRSEKDVTICGLIGRIALFLRQYCPPLYFWIMERRARKLDAQDATTDSDEIKKHI